MHTDEKATCIFAASVVILVITWLVFEPVCTVSDARRLLAVWVTFCPVPVRCWVAIQPPGCIPSIAIHLVQTTPVVLCVISALTPHSIQHRSEYSLPVQLGLEAILINNSNDTDIAVFEHHTLLVVLQVCGTLFSQIMLTFNLLLHSNGRFVFEHHTLLIVL